MLRQPGDDGLGFLQRERIRLGALVRYALDAGKQFVSDNEVSPAAQRVYEALGRRGYTVEKNPSAKLEEDGTLYSRGWGIYRITAAPEEAMQGGRPRMLEASDTGARAADAPTKATSGEPSKAAKAGTKQPPEPAEAGGAAPARPDEAGGAPTGEPSAPVADYLTREIARIEQMDPDMPVMLEGMDAPRPMREVLAEITALAKQEADDAPLVKVAAECALRG